MSLSDKDITAKNFQEFYNRIKPFLNQTAPSGFTPIGTVISVMGKKAPENYLVCDGTAYNILEYPELAVYIKDQFGSYNYFGGNGTTTFAVPDLRGEFLRGTGTNSHAKQGNGANVGVHQDATVHPRMQIYSNKLYTTGVNVYNLSNADYSENSSTQASVNLATGSASQNHYVTSRPTNTSVLYCIAYKNIFIDVKQAYSLTERVVGTWIDGKPLYQKTCVISDYTGSWDTAHNWSEVGITSNISYIFRIGSLQMHYVAGGEDFWVSDHFHSTGDWIGMTCHTSDFRIGTSYDASRLREAIFTVQYTKTTD